MSNNDVLKKLRVALQLRDEDIVTILTLVDFRISLSEVNAFFRKEDHPNYREAGDQVLRNFLNGLVIHLRGPKPELDASKVVPEKKELPVREERPKAEVRIERKGGAKASGGDRGFRPTKGNRDYPGANSGSKNPSGNLRKRKTK